MPPTTTWLAFFGLAAPFIFAVTGSNLRIEPHHYGGPRGHEPLNQLMVSGTIDYQSAPNQSPRSKLRLRADFESLGRKDNSIDVDRAWLAWPIAYGWMHTLTVGRVHPWDISHHPDAHRPWGLLAQGQPQNRGVLLGQSSDDAFPQPVIQGWLGAHLWSDPSYRFQWGVSVSPMFIPSMGPSVNYGAAMDSRAARFGRRPPAFIVVNNQRFPIQYTIDTSDIAREILQPQLMVHAYWHNDTTVLRPQSWLTFRRAPRVDLVPEITGELDLTPDAPDIKARVRPHFPQQVAIGFSQRLDLGKGVSTLSSLDWTDETSLGVELALNARFACVSYLNRWRQPVSASEFSFEEPRFDEHLVAAQVRALTQVGEPFVGVMYHLIQNGVWWRAGLRSRVSDSFVLDGGIDIFGGGNGAYFGEWRTNDRVYVALSWGFGP